MKRLSHWITYYHINKIYFWNTITPSNKVWISYFQHKCHIQGHNIINLGVIRKDIISGVCMNKHSESIAKSIQVPYRPQQILKRHNSYKSRSKGLESGIWSVLCGYKFIPQNSSHYLIRPHRKVWKIKF